MAVGYLLEYGGFYREGVGVQVRGGTYDPLWVVQYT